MMHTICYGSSDRQQILPQYQEEKVKLIMLKYHHYSLEDFEQIINQASSFSFVPLQTQANNQEALQRKKIEHQIMHNLVISCNNLDLSTSTKQPHQKNT